jgi:hypothetical protein
VIKAEKFATVQALTTLVAVSALVASATGLTHPTIYKLVVLDRHVPFVFAQDLVSLVAAVLLLIIVLRTNKERPKLHIVRTGLVGYLFYGYGMYVIGGLYNTLYLLYQAVFGLSVFYLIWAFTGIQYERLEFRTPPPLRMALAVCCAAVAILFAPQWVSATWQSIQAHSRPDSDSLFSFRYSIYILDMCFVLPVCVMASIFIFQKKALGLLLAGVIQLKGFVLLLSVALGYLIQPLLGESLDVANTIQYSIVSAVLLMLTVFYFTHTQITTPSSACSPQGERGVA